MMKLLQKRKQEGGYIEIAIPLLLLSVFMLLGLVYDAGTMLLTQRDAINYADSAARAAAMEVDIEHYRATGELRVNQDAAASAAMSYMSITGSEGNVSFPSEREVHVAVSDTWHPRFLRATGLKSREIQGESTARALAGVRDGS